MPRVAEALRRWVPGWWRGEAGPLGAGVHRALLPAELAFGAASSMRNRAYDRGWAVAARPAIPVISIGNISVGGAGKTPFTAWVAARLAQTGRSPAVVMRGYGTDEVAVHREVNPAIPVFAAPRRIDGVRAAAAAGADVAVLDDGFQHRAIARDLDIVLVAAESWTAERHLLPRGPWREPVEALARADLLVVTRKSADAASALAVARECMRIAGPPAFGVCHLAPSGLRALHGGPIPLDALAGRDVLVVASLADPRPFVRQVEELGARVELLDYPDHHAFSRADVRTIRDRAGDRPLVCTRKEAVKLRGLMEGLGEVLVLEQGVFIEMGLDTIEGALRRVAP